MRTIRIIALLGAALTILQIVILLIALRSYPQSFWELVPALLMVSWQLLTFTCSGSFPATGGT